MSYTFALIFLHTYILKSSNFHVLLIILDLKKSLSLKHLR